MNLDIKISNKNLLEWSHFEDWESGASAAPTNHTLAGASATIARESTIIKHGTYSAAVTRAGTDTTLYYDFPDYADYLGRTMTFGCWVYATVASRGRLSISDGVSSAESSYHTGVAGWEYLTVSRAVDASATRIRVEMQVNSGNTTVYFDSGSLVSGSLLYTDLSDEIESWDLNRKYRNAKFSVPRRDGAIINSIHFAEKTLSVKGKVCSTALATARTNWDSILQYLNDGEKDIYLYDDRFVRGYLINADHNYKAALRIIDFSAQFVIQDPFSRYIQRLRTTQAISSSPTAFTVTNNGNIYTRPKISFIAGSDITTCQLQNLSRAENMVFSSTVSAGNTLEIDSENLTVENNSVDSLSSFSGDFIVLNPGINNLKFTGSNCTIKIDWFDKWL